MSVNSNNISFKPFAGFEFDPKFNKKVEGGAQKKASYTGMYRNIKNNEIYYIKKSFKYPGDDIAEVITSRLSRFLGANAAECEFVVSRTGELYVASKCYNEFQPLVPAKERGLSKGYLGSNPISKNNKKAIHSKLKSSLQIEDVAKNLASFLLLNQMDGHVGNFGIYKQKVQTPNGVKTKSRVCSIDFGWGLANIFDDSSRKINLFETLSPLGSKGTHKFGGIPTNHFKDFDKIINSPCFIDSIEKTMSKMEEPAFEAELKKTIDYIVNCTRGEHRKQKQLQYLVDHMKLKIPDNIVSIQNKKAFILKKLIQRFKERTISLALTKAMLQIKLRKDGKGNYITAKKCLEDLKSVIHKYLPGRKINLFMPEFKPESVKTLLKNVIEDAKQERFLNKKDNAYLSGLIRFSEEVREGRNPVRGNRFKRQSVAILNSSVKNRDELIRQSLLSLAQKYVKPVENQLVLNKQLDLNKHLELKLGLNKHLDLKPDLNKKLDFNKPMEINNNNKNPSVVKNFVKQFENLKKPVVQMHIKRSAQARSLPALN